MRDSKKPIYSNNVLWVFDGIFVFGHCNPMLNTINLHGLCSILYVAYVMGFHYITFVRISLTLVRQMNSVGLNSKDIVNSVGVFNDGLAMNSIFNQSL